MSDIEKGGTDRAECETCGMMFEFFEQVYDDPPDECTCCHLGVDPDDPRHRGNDKSHEPDISEPSFDKEGFGV